MSAPKPRPKSDKTKAKADTATARDAITGNVDQRLGKLLRQMKVPAYVKPPSRPVLPNPSRAHCEDQGELFDA